MSRSAKSLSAILPRPSSSFFLNSRARISSCRPRWNSRNLGMEVRDSRA